MLLHDELESQRESEQATEAAVREAIEVLGANLVEISQATRVLSKIEGLTPEILKRELVHQLTEARDAARAAELDARRAAKAMAKAAGQSSMMLRSPRASRELMGIEDGDVRDDSLHGTRALLRLTTTESMVIELDELIFRRKIGSGSAGVTYLALYQGSIVAVKMASSSGVDDWKREVEALSQLQHPNIIRCMGVICATPSFGLILEYCEGGDLSTRLRQPTPAGFLFRVGRDVVAGMEHLHCRGVLHRDLKGANLLIDKRGMVKITDFGLAALAPDDTRTGGWLTAETGTYRWMAPEVCMHEQYSRSADVFSFGCVLYELITHEVPFADRSPLQAAVAVSLNNIRPELPAGLPPTVAELLNNCWLRDPAARPSFSSVRLVLDALPACLTLREHAWIDAEHGHPVYAKARHGSHADADDERATATSSQRKTPNSNPLMRWVDGLVSTVSTWLMDGVRGGE